MGGRGWRAPVVLFADPESVPTGLRWTGSAGPGGYAHQVVRLPAPRGRWDGCHVVTVLPTDLLARRRRAVPARHGVPGAGPRVVDRAAPLDRQRGELAADRRPVAGRTSTTGCSRCSPGSAAATAGSTRSAPASSGPARADPAPGAGGPDRRRRRPGRAGASTRTAGPGGSRRRWRCPGGSGSCRCAGSRATGCCACSTTAATGWTCWRWTRPPRTCTVRAAGDRARGCAGATRTTRAAGSPSSTAATSCPARPGRELLLVVSQWNTATNWPYHAMQFRVDVARLRH